MDSKLAPLQVESSGHTSQLANNVNYFLFLTLWGSISSKYKYENKYININMSAMQVCNLTKMIHFQKICALSHGLAATNTYTVSRFSQELKSQSIVGYQIGHKQQNINLLHIFIMVNSVNSVSKTDIYNSINMLIYECNIFILNNNPSWILVNIIFLL